MIDWIEMIPISETRDYVQRVVENLEIYRARTVGTAVGARIKEDLSRGETPVATRAEVP